MSASVSPSPTPPIVLHTLNPSSSATTTVAKAVSNTSSHTTLFYHLLLPPRSTGLTLSHPDLSLEATLLDVAQGLALSPGRAQGLALSPVRNARPYQPARTSLYHTPLATASGGAASAFMSPHTLQSYHLSPTHTTTGNGIGGGGGGVSMSPDAWQVID